MKNYSYTFSIDKPCSESWDNMSASEKGKFCMNCQHEVIDFSSLRDDEIIRIIEQSKGNVCGRFKEVQLNRSMKLSYNVARPFSIKAIIAGMVLLTVVSPVYLNATDQPVVYEQQQYSSINTNREIVKDSTYILKGRLLSKSDSTALEGMRLQLSGGSSTVISDINGRFELEVSKQYARQLFSVSVFSKKYIGSTFEVNGLKTDYNQEYIIYSEVIPMKMGKVRIQKDTTLNK